MKAASDWAALSRGLLEIGDLERKAGRIEAARRLIRYDRFGTRPGVS
jgi:hypothetical protein